MLLLATGLPQTLEHWNWRNLVKDSGIAPPPGRLERIACACCLAANDADRSVIS